MYVFLLILLLKLFVLISTVPKKDGDLKLNWKRSIAMGIAKNVSPLAILRFFFNSCVQCGSISSN
jgi:hypothetical protein